jgi:hypothetical protein
MVIISWQVNRLDLTINESHSRVWLGLWQSNHLADLLPLPALFQQIDSFESLQDIALGGDGAGASETTVLRHKKRAATIPRQWLFSNELWTGGDRPPLQLIA